MNHANEPCQVACVARDAAFVMIWLDLGGLIAAYAWQEHTHGSCAASAFLAVAFRMLPLVIAVSAVVHDASLP